MCDVLCVVLCLCYVIRVRCCMCVVLCWGVGDGIELERWLSGRFWWCVAVYWSGSWWVIGEKYSARIWA